MANQMKGDALDEVNAVHLRKLVHSSTLLGDERAVLAGNLI